jgi:elongation factor P
MLNYTDLRQGTVFLLDSQPYEVLEFNFLRMQQRKPVVQTKIKNLINGKIISRNFQPSETFEGAEVKFRDAKFLYAHRGKFVFSEINDPSKRHELGEEQIGDAAKFLKPNSAIRAMEFNNKIINVSLPIKMEFKVMEAPPSVKGNTAQGGTKMVKLETGAMISVPLFVEAGDIVRINTQTGQYTERAEKGK